MIRKEGSSRRLTLRELSICQLISEAYSNKEIAAKHGVTVNTVITQVAHIFDKLGFSSRVEVATWWQATQTDPSDVSPANSPDR